MGMAEETTWPDGAEIVTVAAGIPDDRPEDAALGVAIAIHREGHTSAPDAWAAIIGRRLAEHPTGADVLRALAAITRRQHTLVHLLEVA